MAYRCIQHKNEGQQSIIFWVNPALVQVALGVYARCRFCKASTGPARLGKDHVLQHIFMETIPSKLRTLCGLLRIVAKKAT